MFSSLLLAFREGLEAALIVGIIYAYLIQIQRKDLRRYVFSGVFIGAAVSLVGGYLGFRQAQQFGEESGEVFEGLMMLLASGLIAYFIVWMGNQAKNISSDIKSKVNSRTNGIGLLVLSFISVFREGMELVIFNLTKISENAAGIAAGSAAGIAIAVIVAYVIFKTSISLNLKLIFKILGLVLIFIGGETFAEGLLKFIDVNEELFEKIFMAVYILPSLYVFFKNDIKRAVKTA